MPHYLVETRGERLHWRDVEALPLYAGAAIALVLIGRLLAGVLGPAMLPTVAKVAVIVAILGIRHAVLDARPKPGAAPDR